LAGVGSAVGETEWVVDELADGVAVAFGGLGGRACFAWCVGCALGAIVALGDVDGLGPGELTGAATGAASPVTPATATDVTPTAA
jgi:hypothetical protein